MRSLNISRGLLSALATPLVLTACVSTDVESALGEFRYFRVPEQDFISSVACVAGTYANGRPCTVEFLSELERPTTHKVLVKGQPLFPDAFHIRQRPMNCRSDYSYSVTTTFDGKAFPVQVAAQHLADDARAAIAAAREQGGEKLAESIRKANNARTFKKPGSPLTSISCF